MAYFSKVLSLVFCLILPFSLCSADQMPKSGIGLGDFMQDVARTGAIVAIVSVLEKNGYTKSACTLGGIAALSELEKQNPKFFNNIKNIIWSPAVFARKRCERLFCGGESLTWNELITWRTRVMKLLSPLTKQTTVVDLSRDKRLRLIDQDDSSEALLDEHWVEYVQHIEKQLSFTIKRLDVHLNYYQDKNIKKVKNNKKSFAASLGAITLDPVMQIVGTVGRAGIRASIKRDEEIAFYLEELKTYLQEIITYTKSVAQLSSLDKDRVKQIMNSTCDTFEHVATLVDANTAAAGRDAVGQLTIQKETSGHTYAGGYSPYMVS